MLANARVALLVLLAAAVEGVLGLIIAAAARHPGREWVAIAASVLIVGVFTRAAFAVMSRGFSRRLARMQRVLSAVGAGDLTASTRSTRDDELGDLERALDATVAQMRTVIGTMQQSLETFHDGRIAIATNNKTMLDTAELTAGQAYDAGVSAEQVTDSINIVAASTEELIATVNEIARHANLAADIAYTAVTQGQEAGRGVGALSDALQRVDDIAAVITTIAGQTHLLALNASIEAARAGDAGRGFAVVATEVKELSKATADATDQVRSIVSGIHEGSARASAAIREITDTVARIQQSTAGIASAVTQQTSTTREIGRVSALAAEKAFDITGRVAGLHKKAREVAYSGAGNDATRSKDFEVLERTFRAAVGHFDVGDFQAQFVEDEEVDQQALNERGTTTADGVTTVMHYVQGTGPLEWTYDGAWLHGDGYAADASGDAYSSVTGDTATMRFTGTRFRLVGTHDQQQGIAEVWVDDQPPAQVDFYAPTRGQAVLWESPALTPGEHTFHLTVAGTKHPDSRYFWVAIANGQVEQ
jgi:methyl-accepting chemotaxis protein